MLPLGRVGHVAGYLAAAAVIAIAALLLLARDEDEAKAGRIATSRGLGLIPPILLGGDLIIDRL